MSASVDDNDKKCWITCLNGHELLTNSSTDLVRDELLVQGFIRENPTFIPVDISGLCFEFYYDTDCDALRVNTLDMGFNTILHAFYFIQ